MSGLSSFFKRFKKANIQTGALQVQTGELNGEIEHLQNQIQTAQELTRLAAETSGDQLLMKEISDLLQQRCLLHYVGVFLVDAAREYAVLQYGTGDQGRQMLSASYRLATGGYSLAGKCIQTREQISSIMDETDPARFENPFLPQSRCELALPLIKNDQLLGVLDVHSAAAKELDASTVTLLQQAANLLAISLQKPVPAKPVKGSVFLNLDEFEKAVKNENKDVTFSFTNPAYLKPRLKESNHALPLVLHHETIGSLDLEMGDQEWTSENEDFIQAVAAQALTALENISRLDQIIHHAERERRILEITSKIRSTNDTQKMLQIALEEISSHLGVSQAQIVLNVPEIPRTTDTLGTTNTKSLQKKMTTGQLPEL
ncbi:MAG: GAF domain-containing protein [Anaerolineaceae bacterium]